MIRKGSVTIVDITDIDVIENWYLATDQASGVTRNTEGWTTTIQTMDSSKPYLWNYEVTKGTGNVVINTTEPAIIGRFGTDGTPGAPGTPGAAGRGISKIDEYYALNNSTTAPRDADFDTTVKSPNPTNRYLWNYEVVTYTDTSVETTEKRIIGVHGEKPVITSNPKQDGVTIILADGTEIARIADGKEGEAGHSPEITTSRAPGSTTTKIYVDGVEVGSIEDGSDGHSPVITTTKTGTTTHIYVDGAETATINDGSSVRISSATKTDGVTTVVLVDDNGTQTLTIADGEDGEDGQPGAPGTNSYIHVAWANDTSGTDFSTTVSTNKLYMGTYVDENKTDSTDYRKYNWTKIKGESGPQGVSVTKTETEYYRRLSGAAAPTSSSTGSVVIPDYIDGCTYYKRTITYLNNGTSIKGDWIQDTGLTDEVKKAYDAWAAAGKAEQRTAKIINDSTGTTVAAGVNGADVTEGTISTYGYNTIMAPNYLGLRYNDINLSKLTTTGLDLYIPTMSGTTPVQGKKGLELTSNAITFYNPNTDKAQLIIGANGTLQSGNYNRGTDSKFASAGTKIDLTYGEIYSPYFRLSQGMDGLNAGAYIHGTIEALDGFIGSDSTNYWEIGNYTDYNLSETAKIIGHGSSFIQLGDSSTWRLATNRIHTGWHVDSDKLLHFPKFTDGTNTLYWDYGLHSPTEKSDKFLYIRTASGDAQLSNLLYDIDDSYATPQWDYKFYIDGEGNIHAGDIYSHGSLISGTSAPYLLKSGGTMTGSITMSNGGKFIGDLTGNADSASNAAKVNGLTVQTAVPANAVFTDKNVQTSQANTTKLYLVGTSSTGTSTGTLNFDSNIYADTTAGALHATTYNGYTLAAASAKGVDTSMPTTATDSNVPTTKLMKSFVEGKNYLTSETDPTVPSWAKAASKPSYALSEITDADDIKAIEALTGTKGFLKKTAANTWTLDTNTYLTSYTETDPVFKASAAYGISSTDISNWNSKTSNTGTVTSVRVQASSPLQSSQSTAQSSTLNTTISFANQNKNLVLAGPSTGNAAAPTFRSLVADDIPGLAWSKITSGKPTTLSGYGITDAAGSNALVGLSAKSNDAGVTTFTATRASGEDPLSFEVSIVASAAAGANALRDSEGPISKGSVTKPVYFSNGVPVEANTYAGGTAVTLNNASKVSSTASFYAPTSGGTTSQVLVGNGTTSAPVWKAISDIVPSKASTADAFSSAAEIKLTGDTTGSASSTKGWSITTKTDRISTIGDNRAVATTPNDYVNKIIFQGLKTNSSFGSPSTDSYSYVVGLRGWADSSGGNSHEFAFNNSGINHRSGATSWGAWEKLVTSANYTDYTVTKTGTGASGTWGINITGSAGSVAWSGVTSKPTTISGYGITDAVLYGGVDTGLGSGTTAAAAKEYYANTAKVPTNSIKMFLNSSGVEYTTLFSNRGSYGSILKWGYNDRYIRILRNQSGTWKSDDWEKIDAGYADIAGNAKLLGYQDIITTLEDLNNFKGSGTGIETTKINAIEGHSGTLGKNDGIVISVPWNAGYGHQIYVDDNTYAIHHRYYTTSSGTGVWADWVRMIDSSNYTSYTVTKTGEGASGTWGISISGTAAKATQDKNGNDITTKYVTVDTDQTITASQKTFNGAIRWGTASKYGAAHYDSTLEAIVFSFA